MEKGIFKFISFLFKFLFKYFRFHNLFIPNIYLIKWRDKVFSKLLFEKHLDIIENMQLKIRK